MMAQLSPRSPNVGRLTQHMALYKATTPTWKDQYRQRCLGRIRDRRQCLFNKFRNIPKGMTVDNDTLTEVENIMSKEIEKLNEENGNRFMMDQDTKNPAPWLDVDEEVITFMEEVHQELYQQEQKLQEELRMQELAFEAQIEQLNEFGVGYVVCPFCLKSRLQQSDNLIYCSCGVRFRTQEPIPLNILQKMICEGVNRHDTNCLGEIIFSLNNTEFANIIISCKDCEFMYIVI